MKIYCVMGGFEARHFGTMREAKTEAKSQLRVAEGYDPDYRVDIILCDVGRVDKAKVIALANGFGWAEAQTIVWSSDGSHKNVRK